MKQRIFTIVMMLALVVMAGSSWAAVGDKFNPYPGGVYSYNLPFTIATGNTANATLTIDKTAMTTGAAGTTLGATTPASLTNMASSVSAVAFSITYDAAAAGVLTINFSITDNVSACSNNIFKTITIAPKPTYTLDIASSITTTCQTRTGAADNAADALGTGVVGETNTFTYTVTPVVSDVSGTFNYSYTIDLPSNAVLLSFNNGASGVGALSGNTVTYTGVTSVVQDVFTVTFRTTTGVATQTLTASLTAASSTLTVVSGGGNYTATISGNSTQSVTVNAVPTIGAFN